jgi:hypothetical protein
MKAVIDRFEGDIAVLILTDGERRTSPQYAQIWVVVFKGKRHHTALIYQAKLDGR